MKQEENKKTEEKKKKNNNDSKSTEYDEEALRLLGLDGTTGKQKPKKPVLYFPDAGLVIPVWGVMTLEKTFEWAKNPIRIIYGIVINKGLETSAMCPVGEKSLWFEKEKLRDERFNEIIGAMDSSNFKVITV